MFASFDPVALDQACADACMKEHSIPGSLLHDMEHELEHVCEDHFINAHPDTNWKVQLEHAEKIGVGTREYELIDIS